MLVRRSSTESQLSGGGGGTGHASTTNPSSSTFQGGLYRPPDPKQPTAAAAPPPSPTATLFATLDRNHDGHVTRIEIIQAIRGAAKRGDKALLEQLTKNLGLPDHVAQEDSSRKVFGRSRVPSRYRRASPPTNPHALPPHPITT